jgi:hypothetical protein
LSFGREAARPLLRFIFGKVRKTSKEQMNAQKSEFGFSVQFTRSFINSFIKFLI